MAIPYKWLDALIDRGWLPILTSSELKVLLALGKFVNNKSRDTWVGTDTLVTLTNFENSTVYQALHGLRKHNLLDTSRQMRPSRVREREYSVEVHTLVEVERIPIAPPREKRSAPLSTFQEPGEYPETKIVDGGMESSYEPENGETPRQHSTGESRTGQLKAFKDIELISSSNGSGNGHQDPPLVRLNRIIQDIFSSSGSLNETIVRELVRAGGVQGWTEQEVLAVAEAVRQETARA
jgi:hypothetical protein